MDTLRAQTRFGMNDTTLSHSYHATHPFIIQCLPKLDIVGNQHHKALLQECGATCPICQTAFVADGQTDMHMQSRACAETIASVKGKNVHEQQTTPENAAEMDLDSDSPAGPGPSAPQTVSSVQHVVTEWREEVKLQELEQSQTQTDGGIVRLWCGHIFHNECVSVWLRKRNTCPLCRYELPSNNPNYELKRRTQTYQQNVA
eukprot:CAMPEP_0202710526 /NCGR_PEP_ID=MMETSP1385-20130828/22498_1 /ASSEMBLY_ACC=CAM_ASM_000861 /TAXON_ID=933848 /ORGANISM="Elphidium margaritaceum" /LENGTH=201 /DNA_ID=CAMNT_0049370081 /DNA_START=47 /DNA_END=648 /DNA_ORIENTATION=+